MLEAEKAAGPAVIQEVSEAEAREQRATERPSGGGDGVADDGYR